MDQLGLVLALRPAAELVGVATETDDPVALLRLLLERVERERRDDRSSRVVELAAAGRRDTEIATERGCSADTVRGIRRRYGVPGQGPHTPTRSGWEDRIRALHAQGLTTHAIAEATGWAIRTVQQRLVRLRLPANRARSRAQQ